MLCVSTKQYHRGILAVLWNVVFAWIWQSSQAQVCPVPDWFLSSGSSWTGGSDFTRVSTTSPLPYNAFGTSIGDSPVSIRIAAATPDEIVMTAVTAPAPPFFTIIASAGDTARSVDSTNSLQYTLDNAPQSKYDSLMDEARMVFPSLLPADQATDPQFVAILTYNCVPYSGQIEYSLMQVIVIFTPTEIIIVFQYDQLDVTTGNRAGVLRDDGTLFPLFDPTYFSDPSHFLTQTNAVTPGRWIIILNSVSDGAIVPAVVANETPAPPNTWSSWRCQSCGGCGTRFRRVGGRKQFEYGPCGTKSRCRRGRNGRREWLYSPKVRYVGRGRKCCYDYRKASRPPSPRPRFCKALKGWYT